ncbi:PREDICTED: dynein regulatory complex subunit 3-like [Habropoda laboriosa]|uniref:dynein regulatory complex subunit 3-like n=1 Tax=Habropoda laboriosa TaxID=597456 RepID=UPI00083D2464|nr:PREDICTED: dynein regulatory complex subunit 3-like [Habropoda laboriosa]
MMVQEDVPTILQEFVQARVINQNMLINLIIEQGPKGVAGKLFYEDGIKLDENKEIRIEFLNILKIDHLWVMPNLVKLKLSNNIIEKIENLDVLVNLKELDLSFNHIRIMENLNNLTKLEILLLFNNEINEIEDIDNLYNLTIFSIGNNAIVDWKHTLNTLAETEMKEKQELDAKNEYEKKLAFLTTAYVEHLDGDYLFLQMFENDKEGKELSMVNEDTQNAFEQYKINFITICEELCEIGIKENDKRMGEINVFNTAVNEGKTASQNQGRIIVNGVLQRKTVIIASIKQLLKKLVGDVDITTLEDISQKAQQFSEEFNDMITDAWTKLMSIEVELHEQIEDISEVFRMNLSDMVDAFLTNVRGYFSQLRNCEAEYNDTVNGAILYYLSGFGDDTKMPQHMLNLCEDKDMLNYNLNNSHDKHLQVIDTREDTMLNRVKNWLEEYSEQLIKYESERNNQQILETSHFADSQQQELLQLLQQLNLNVNDSEVILALDT